MRAKESEESVREAMNTMNIERERLQIDRVAEAKRHHNVIVKIALKLIKLFHFHLLLLAIFSIVIAGCKSLAEDEMWHS